MKKEKIGLIKPRFKRLIGYAVWVLLVLFLVSTVRNINRVVNINKQVDEEEEKIGKMQEENRQLAAQIIEAQSSEFIESQIRNKLGYAKPEETVVIMPEESIVKSLAPPETSIETSLPDPNWLKWKKLFF